MKKRTFDFLFILTAGILFSALAYFEILNRLTGYILIPVIAAYFIGQYSEKKFKN